MMGPQDNPQCAGRSLLAGVPVVLECVAVVAGDGSYLHASKSKVGMIRNVGDFRGLTALRACVQVRGLNRLPFQFRNASFERFNPFRKLFEGLPNGGFVEDFQNV